MEVLKKVETLQVVDYTCDVCNQSCTTGYSAEYATLEARWGFDSSKDGEIHICHFCENCYNKVAEFIKKELNGKIQVDNSLNM